MTTAPQSAGDWSDRALSLLFSDGLAASRLASEIFKMPSANAGQRAIAHTLRALYELREGEVEEGLRQRDAAKALVEASPGMTQAADLLQQVQAQWHRREGRLDEAEALLRPLHGRAEQRPTIDAYVTTGALGIVLSMTGDDHGALDMFYQALEQARRSGEDSLVVNALNNLGSYQSDLHNLEDALPLLEECLAGAQRLGSRRQVIYAAGNLVQCLCQMRHATRALEIARKFLIGQIQPDDLPSLHRDEEIAQALLDNDLVDEAESALGGEAHVDPLSNELATARIWLGARILLTRGRADEALQLCLTRQELLHEQGEEGTVAIDRVNLLRVAAQAADQTDEHELAYRLLGQAFAKYEQLLGRAARSRQLSLQITHRLRHAEWERDSAQQAATELEALNASLRSQVAETERLQLLLQAQALEDPLTGLHNRRHLLDAGAALLSLLRRQAEPLAVVIVDLDHFKQVNDRHGHESGDRVLRGFAELARGEMRAEDIVCRYGGEEFVFLLPGARASQAAARVDELLRKFGKMHFEDGKGAFFSCKFSAGVADSVEVDEALPGLLACADSALYTAKNAGRGRVQVAVAPA
jgi:diguanylate cyclase (GGDEF)-like protein